MGLCKRAGAITDLATSGQHCGIKFLCSKNNIMAGKLQGAMILTLPEQKQLGALSSDALI